MALDRFDLAFESGEFVVLLGPSGSGKTTACRVLAGLETASGGSVEVNGRDVTPLPPRERGMSMVFQNYALYAHKSVYDNIAYPLKVRGTPRADIDRKVRAMAAMLRIGNLLDRRPRQLSGGQAQRVAVARALVWEPEICLMDEPLSNLDALLRLHTRTELKRLHAELGRTFVFVTHDQEEAMEVADRIVVMNHGRVEQVGGPRDLYEHPANAFVMGFVGPVTRLGEFFVRPHDVEVRRQPNGTTSEAMVERLVHLGFEVRAELLLGDGQRVWAQLSREGAEELELAQGQIVFVRPSRTRQFAEVPAG
jgi:ABC-type sugar transport system ATPase subunit